MDAGAFIHQMTHGPFPDHLLPLHRVYRRRYKSGIRHVSRCKDLFPPDLKRTRQMFRFDSMEFQYFACPRLPLMVQECMRKFTSKLKNGKMCRDLTDRFEIYGYVGRGTSSFILAARDKGNMRRQYALKLQYTGYRNEWKAYSNPIFCNYVELGSKLRRYIPVEAVILQLLSECPRFPRLDSVYMHGDFAIVAMSSEAVVKRPERETLITDYPMEHCFPSYCGEELFNAKSPRLTEIQVCKVASHLLQALVYLMDLNVAHDDLSHRNYVVDENLNLTLVDLGLCRTAAAETDWHVENWPAILASELLITPQIANFLNQSTEPTPTRAARVVRIPYPHDLRKQILWKLGALIYDLLHGYAPWEQPEWDPEVGVLRSFHEYKRTEKSVLYIRERRQRMVFEDLAIDPGLSQDCIDVLRALLAREEADRPTFREVVSFPWFQGHWADYPAAYFQRPPFLLREASPGVPRYSENFDEGVEATH
ncbi:hypothetical protein LOZ12_006128 [Ophidiomyces ophidiicola]|uniref:Uncharacterized protein n=1 Tax=Ophidiomyces ophidiicola TaxID=1387563 RepID=A0ACB8URH3_9EURO|nr:hypothetical protein LOZ64_006147 [Ophidiomyces ophidiicola]KAI1934697.1 hypothetical protein LOZ62_006214 [Ophidiomyces ophidiicola]KAI1972820.1 hypothetical protein LOZ56_002167 [Ophidiomyces ophidiicola]KAI2000181.1 hypothetical protein LOZ50_006149 [Ophidiomyces ophidiicola]KAI2004545.1 hypothetical protein LOZ49_005804 [Ophidiomyces ophidiicola]